MLDRFKQFMVKLGAFDPQRPFLVGVSGGADSLALLYLLHSAGYPVVAAYFDHSLREQSKEEVIQVAAIADHLRVLFVHETQDVRLHAEKYGLTIEAAGRALRYRFLFDCAQQYSAQAVAVAHHADDQVETILLHLLRGSGLQGLQGMSAYWLPNPWSATIPLIRPLLAFWKTELEAYLDQRGVQAMLDSTNLDPTYLRNRLRHEVLPLLEQIQPELRPGLLRLARIAQDEQAVLEPLVEAGWQASLLGHSNKYVLLSAAALRTQPVGVLRRICRRALSMLRPGLPDIDFSAVERMIAFIQAPVQVGQADLVAGLRLLIEGDKLWLAGWDANLPLDRWPQLPAAEACLPVPVPGLVELADGWYMTCSLEKAVESAVRAAADNSDPFQAWLDYDQCGTGLHLRTRWEGARFQPLGLNGQTQKVSDRMIDAHIPSRARPLWPLLCTGDQVLWIPGLAAAQPARLTSLTRRVLYLVIRRT